MKTKHYLFIIFCITLFSLGFFFLIFFNINPYYADTLSKAAFFISIFLFISGILTLIGFYFRVKLSNNEVFYANLFPSIRQAILISTIIVVLMVLKMLNVLNLWDGLMFSLAILLLELFFQNNKLNMKQK